MAAARSWLPVKRTRPPVATGRGATALTRMPVAATSSAADRVKPLTVYLLAL
jgi:hypothetical protein